MSEYHARRRAAAGRGLDWRHDWLRFLIRRHGRKATMIAVGSALAMRASNADGTVYLSAETLAAEVGRGVNHVKVARGDLVKAGFLADAGRTRDGCRVWHLTTPAVALDDDQAVATERRLHDRLRGPKVGPLDDDDGHPDAGPKVGSGGSEDRTAGVRRSDDKGPKIGPHTGDGTGHGTGDRTGNRYERARERDSAPAPGGPGYAAPLAGPRSDGDHDTGHVGDDRGDVGPVAASPDTGSHPGSTSVAGPGRPAENDAQRRADTDTGSPRRLSPAVAEFRRQQAQYVADQSSTEESA